MKRALLFLTAMLFSTVMFAQTEADLTLQQEQQSLAFPDRPVLVQKLPVVKPWYRSGQFWAGQFAAGAPIAVDFYSTSALMHRCPGCKEVGNVFLGGWRNGGSRPSDARIAIVGLGEWAAWGALHAACHHQSRFPKLCSLMIVGATSAVHIQPAIRNFRIMRRY